MKKNKELQEQCLVEFKQLIRESGDKHLLAVIEEDDFLMTFIVGRKYLVSYAFDTAKNYMAAKHDKYKPIFDMPVSSVRHIIESGFFGVLKHRDAEGRIVCFLRISNLDIKTMEFDEITRAAILLVDTFWYDHDAVESGQVVIIDYSGYSFTIFKRYSFSQKLNFALLFLHNYPSKFKAAHVYNNPKLVGYTYSLIKPFLPEKLKKRIFLHAYHKENLLQHFSPDMLPQWMGGTLTDEEALDTRMIDKVLETMD